MDRLISKEFTNLEEKKMKKKYYAGIMMVAVSMAITACGGGSSSPKNEKAELAAELEKELSADDKAAIKEAQAELKGETEKETEPEADSDDPWTNGMLEKFGCADMPRPREDYPIKDIEFKEFKAQKDNGDKVDNGYELTIKFPQRPYLYKDYVDELDEYWKNKDLYLKYSIRNTKEPVLIHGNIADMNKGDLPKNMYSNSYFKYEGHWVYVVYYLGDSVKGESEQRIRLYMKYNDKYDDIDKRRIVEVDENGDIID